jgi:hypothetical protein
MARFQRKWHPTAEQRAKVVELAMLGTSDEDIGRFIGIPHRSTRRIFDVELKRGRAQGRIEILLSLRRLAVEEKDGQTLRFLARCRVPGGMEPAKQREPVPRPVINVPENSTRPVLITEGIWSEDLWGPRASGNVAPSPACPDRRIEIRFAAIAIPLGPGRAPDECGQGRGRGGLTHGRLRDGRDREEAG